MSEQQPERAEGGRGRPGQGKKILGMPRGQALAFGAALLVLGGYMIYRARKNAQAAQQQQQASPCPDGSTPDANGNCPQNGQDWSGAIDTLQSEIADLQGAMAGAGGGGSGAGSVGAATGTSTAPPTSAPVTTPAAGTPIAKIPNAGPISNLRVTKTGTTSFTVAWDKATNATGGYSYIVRDLATHQQVGQPHHVGAAVTSATVTGLKAKTDYNFGIQALPGGAGDNIHVRTK